MRSGAFTALARLEPMTFLSVLAGLDADDAVDGVHALAARSAGCPAAGCPAADGHAQDRDRRVIPAVLNALIAAKAGGMDKVLLERLSPTTSSFARRPPTAWPKSKRRAPCSRL